MSEIDNAVCLGVEFLAPRGSCTPERWLTFEFEATNEDRSSFRWRAQYSATSNYVNWRTLYGTVPHVKVADYRDAKHPFTPWVPEQELGETQSQMSRDGTKVAPGFVIADGCHDSCWRDNACTVYGYPSIPTTTTDGTICRNSTRWFNFRNSTFLVPRISVKGPPNTWSGSVWAGEGGSPKYAHHTDDTWENNTGLTGPWAIYHGLSKLAGTVGKTCLETRLRGIFHRGEWGKRNHSEINTTIHYRLTDGLVTHKGIPDPRNDWFSQGWEEVPEPYLLDEAAFRRDCGVKDYGKFPWKRTHLFPDLIGG